MSSLQYLTIKFYVHQILRTETFYHFWLAKQTIFAYEGKYSFLS